MGGDTVLFAHDHGSFHAIFKLPNVARPGMAIKRFKGIRVKYQIGLVVLGTKFGEKCLSQQPNVSAPILEGFGQGDKQDVKRTALISNRLRLTIPPPKKAPTP